MNDEERTTPDFPMLASLVPAPSVVHGATDMRPPALQAIATVAAPPPAPPNRQSRKSLPPPFPAQRASFSKAVNAAKRAATAKSATPPVPLVSPNAMPPVSVLEAVFEPALVNMPPARRKFFVASTALDFPKVASTTLTHDPNVAAHDTARILRSRAETMPIAPPAKAVAGIHWAVATIATSALVCGSATALTLSLLFGQG